MIVFIDIKNVNFSHDMDFCQLYDESKKS